MKTKQSGFTLLEILLVVGIIAILAGIVIVAINPSKQLATVRNTERKSDLKQIEGAVNQYYIDQKYYPSTITTTLKEICDTGSVSSTTTAVNSSSCGSLVNLSVLVPTYFTAVPKDTNATSTGNGTGYYIIENAATKRIGFSANLAELGDIITIGSVPEPEVLPCGDPNNIDCWSPFFTGTFDEALDFASSYSLNGYSDWRLPSSDELYAALYDNFNGSGVNPGGFYETEGYWNNGDVLWFFDSYANPPYYSSPPSDPSYSFKYRLIR